MDHILENKFLTKEGASKEALQEKDEDTTLITGDSMELVQFQVFESFVKEKHSLLGYVKAMVVYSAKKQGIEEDLISQLYPAEKFSMIKEKVISNDHDHLFNFKNRIIIIVSVISA